MWKICSISNLIRWVGTPVGIVCMMCMAASCNGFLSRNSSVTTDTLWCIPPRPIKVGIRYTNDYLKCLLIHYQPIDSMSQFVWREIQCVDSPSPFRKRTYILQRIDSLQYRLKDPLYKKGEKQDFMVCSETPTYINMKDTVHRYETPYSLWGSALRYVGDKVCYNPKGEQKNYHIMYGQDVSVYVGHYHTDSIYFYFDRNMRLKKILNADGTLCMSTHEDRDYQ